jgi:tetratricopeptide (TPR) repeat protein
MLQSGRRFGVLGAVSAFLAAAVPGNPVQASVVEVPLALVSAARIEAPAAQTQTFIATAKDLMRAGRAEDALVVLDQATASLAQKGKRAGRGVNADESEALFMRAFALTELGRRADAVEALEQLVALVPTSPRYMTELAFAYRKAGDKVKALETYRRATAEASQGGEDAQRYRAAALRGVGYMLVDQGDLSGAEAAYRDSLVLDPQSRVATNELAFIARKRAESEQKGG